MMPKVSDSGKQHVEFYRKLKQRHNLLKEFRRIGGSMDVAYCPFFGDGDVADSLYRDCDIYGADLDPERVATATERFSGDNHHIKLADCDDFPFADTDCSFDLCDFDSYANPYKSFLSFWRNSKNRSNRMIMFFTDFTKNRLLRFGQAFDFEKMEERHVEDLNERRELANRWFSKYTKEFVETVIIPDGYRVLSRVKYNREKMTYWGMIISNVEFDKTKDNIQMSKAQAKSEILKHMSNGHSISYATQHAGKSRSTVYKWRDEDSRFAAAWAYSLEDKGDTYEDFLYEAAESGNVQAIITGLKVNKRLSDGPKTSVEVSADRVNVSVKEMTDDELIAIIQRGKSKNG